MQSPKNCEGDPEWSTILFFFWKDRLAPSRPSPNPLLIYYLLRDCIVAYYDAIVVAIVITLMHQSIPALPIPPSQPRGICSHCQLRGWGIRNFYIEAHARDSALTYPRVTPRFLTHVFRERRCVYRTMAGPSGTRQTFRPF